MVSEDVLREILREAKNLSGRNRVFIREIYGGKKEILVKEKDVIDGLKEDVKVVCKGGEKIYVTEPKKVVKKPVVTTMIGNPCGKDEFIGVIHNHTEGPIALSETDIMTAIERDLKVVCSGADGKFACVFFGSNWVIPTISKEELSAKNCSVAYVLDRIEKDGTIHYIRVPACDRDFVEKLDRKWIEDVEKLVSRGGLDGICHSLDGKIVKCRFKDGSVKIFDEKDLG